MGKIGVIIAVVVGAVGSLVCMLRVGHRNRSGLLMLAFGVWVLAPFVGLLWANMVSNRWVGIAVYGVTLVLALGSLAVYGVVAWGPPRPKPASFFLIVPFVSWVVMGIAAVLARRGGRTARD